MVPFWQFVWKGPDDFIIIFVLGSYEFLVQELGRQKYKLSSIYSFKVHSWCFSDLKFRTGYLDGGNLAQQVYYYALLEWTVNLIFTILNLLRLFRENKYWYKTASSKDFRCQWKRRWQYEKSKFTSKITIHDDKTPFGT